MSESTDQLVQKFTSEIKVLLSKENSNLPTDSEQPSSSMIEHRPYTFSPETVDLEFEVLKKIYDHIRMKNDLSISKKVQGEYQRYKSNSSPISLIKVMPSVQEQQFLDSMNKRKETYLTYIADKIKKACEAREHQSTKQHLSPVNQLKLKRLSEAKETYKLYP